MNERIQQLADEAKRYALETYPSPYEPYANLYDKKFAELIVRECTRVAIKKQTENDMNNIVSKNPAQDFAYALIEHFGVEE